MRRMLLVLSLAGLTVLASASDAFAQRRGYGGGWGNSPGISIGVGRGGYYSPYGYYGGRGYSPFYQGYGYSYAPSYYYATPSYYAEPSFLVPTQVRQSYYTAPATAQQSANVTVLVPAADAQVWFENRATTQQGMERLFHSPPLEPNQNFTYTIKARWMENGQAVNQERRVNVQAGQSITVNFRENSRENVPPLPRLPDAIPRE
jgi:uncharacterized protein (TIGR03000 family)